MHPMRRSVTSDDVLIDTYSFDILCTGVIHWLLHPWKVSTISWRQSNRPSIGKGWMDELRKLTLDSDSERKVSYVTCSFEATAFC